MKMMLRVETDKDLTQEQVEEIAKEISLLKGEEKQNRVMQYSMFLNNDDMDKVIYRINKEVNK